MSSGEGSSVSERETPLEPGLSATTAKVTRAEVQKWMSAEKKYLEETELGAGEMLGVNHGVDPDASTSLSTLQVTVNTTIQGDIDDVSMGEIDETSTDTPPPEEELQGEREDEALEDGNEALLAEAAAKADYETDKADKTNLNDTFELEREAVAGDMISCVQIPLDVEAQPASEDQILDNQVSEDKSSEIGDVSEDEVFRDKSSDDKAAESEQVASEAEPSYEAKASYNELEVETPEAEAAASHHDEALIDKTPEAKESDDKIPETETFEDNSHEAEVMESQSATATLIPGLDTNGGSTEILNKAADQMRQLDLNLSGSESTLPQQPPNNFVATEGNANPVLPPVVQEPLKSSVVEQPAAAAASADEVIAPVPAPPKTAPAVSTEAAAAPTKTATTAASTKPKQPKSAQAKSSAKTNEEREKAWRSGNSAAPVASARATAAKQTNGNGAATGAAKLASAAPVKRVPITTAATARKPAAAATGTAPAAPASARTPTRRASAPVTPTTPGSDEQKKLPMNKIKVGAAPSPDVKNVKSKIGSLAAAATHKPATSQVKIEQKKLNWKAESKIGSLSNVKYAPPTSNVKIETKKVEVKGVGSKIGSLQNVKYKPGGGDKKIFDDKYVKKSNPSSNTPSEHEHGHGHLDGSSSGSPIPASTAAAGPAASPRASTDAVSDATSSNNVNAENAVPVGSLVNFGDA